MAAKHILNSCLRLKFMTDGKLLASFFIRFWKRFLFAQIFFNQIKSFSFVRLFLKVFHLNKQKIFFEKFFDYWRTGCETLTFFTMCFKDIDSNLERVARWLFLCQLWQLLYWLTFIGASRVIFIKSIKIKRL